ncbi:hypothetical protein ppKF707_4379 [Metapseudomonas furukawaii]|uniref:Uncharacterized protein n=1 Tax=Metapseudomonas furukawaii TaxID=1149133 RepID=A0AAD1FH06_METFU|nr:hypothetical protein ppKF707_4379 [Pseudomonas furukawaii]BAU75764.1 hypothetical protein KF707C_40760 [Pseudomonas furukawaii]
MDSREWEHARCEYADGEGRYRTIGAARHSLRRGVASEVEHVVKR